MIILLQKSEVGCSSYVATDLKGYIVFTSLLYLHHLILQQFIKACEPSTFHLGWRDLFCIFPGHLFVAFGTEV